MNKSLESILTILSTVQVQIDKGGVNRCLTRRIVSEVLDGKHLYRQLPFLCRECA
jgi:hypothetical protein